MPFFSVISRMSRAVIFGLSVALPAHGLFAEDGPQGIIRPVVLPPYDPGAPACGAPTGLTKVLAFAQDNQRKFMRYVVKSELQFTSIFRAR